jgi:hypothetical protein
MTKLSTAAVALQQSNPRAFQALTEEHGIARLNQLLAMTPDDQAKAMGFQSADHVLEVMTNKPPRVITAEGDGMEQFNRALGQTL